MIVEALLYFQKPCQECPAGPPGTPGRNGLPVIIFLILSKSLEKSCVFFRELMGGRVRQEDKEEQG